MKNLAALFLLLFFFCAGARALAEEGNRIPDTGRDAAISHFMIAMQLADSGESADTIVEELISAIRSDRKNALLPAFYLLDFINEPEIARKAHQVLLELVAENPESFSYRFAAIVSGIEAGVGSRKLCELFPPLEKMLEPVPGADEERNRKRILYFYAENLTDLPDHAAFVKLAAILDKDESSAAKIVWRILVCREASYEYLRELASGKEVEKIQAELHSAAEALIRAAASTEEPAKLVAAYRKLEELEVITPDLLDVFEKLLPPDIFRSLQLEYISKFGSAEDIAAAIELPYPGKTPARDAMFLFYNAIANENLAKAKEIAATFPDEKLRPTVQYMYDFAAGNIDPATIPADGAALDKNTLHGLLAGCKTPDQVLAVAGFADKEFWRDPDFTNAVGYTLAMNGGDLEKAEKLLEYSLKYMPDNSDYLDSMAMILFKKGNLKAAQQMLARALQTLKNRMSYKTLLDHAGDIELALGNREMALTYYRRALKCFSKTSPNIPETEQIRGKIEKLESAENGK